MAQLARQAGAHMFGDVERVLGVAHRFGNAFQNGGQEPSMTSPFGRDIGGVPIGLIGWALSAAGMILLMVGIVLHIVATSRRRRADRDFPVPPPWQGARP